jgi:hypothetical protein
MDLDDKEEFLKRNGIIEIESFINSNQYDSKEKIIKLLEIEYTELEQQQMAMYFSNEEMLNYDPNDLDIIEARAENIKIMEKNIQRMQKIKEDLLKLDRDHYINGKNVFDCFNFKPEKNDTIENKIDNEGDKMDVDDEEKIITEIDL